MRFSTGIFTIVSLFFVFNSFSQLPGCATTVNTFPYAEDFELGTGNWNNIGGDDFDWTRGSGGTPSTNTGPATGSGDTWYMFIETSGGVGTGDQAFLESDCFDLTALTNPLISFDYHMYGNSMGTLNLEISTDGVTYTNIWTLSGDQGDEWFTANIDLAAYGGQTVGFRFTGIDGDSFRGDAAIDKIEIVEQVPMLYSSATTTQASTADIEQCGIDEVIIGIQIETTGSLSPLDITQIDLDFLNSTTIADIDNYSIYYTGTNNTFATTNTFNTGTVPSTTLSVTGSQSLQQGTNYFWVAVNLNTAATVSNIVDIICSQIEVDGTTYVPTVTDPAGSRTIVICPPKPGGLNGATVWFDAKTAVSSGGANYANNDPVDLWDNKMDNAGFSEITQPLATDQPTFATNYWNYNPAIRFDGVDDKLEKLSFQGNTFLDDHDNTFILVHRHYSGIVMLKFFRNGVSNNSFQIENFGGYRFYFNGIDNVSPQDFSDLSLATIRTNNLGNYDIGENGISYYTAPETHAPLNLNLNKEFYMGENPQPAWPLNAEFDISEAIIFSRNLSDLEMNQVESYLAIKYGVTLGVNGTSLNYRSSDGNIVWEAAVNAGYAFDIAGIAKDDATDLEQLRSRSQNLTGGVNDIIKIANGSDFNAPSVFSTDLSHFIWGHDNEAIYNTGNGDFGLTDNGEVIESRIDRVWKAQETGTVGSVMIEVDMSQVFGTAGVGTNDLSALRLLVDEDATFLTNATSISPTSFDNTTNIAYFTHDFQGGSGIGRGFFFTFGSINKNIAPLPIEISEVNYDCTDYSAVLNWTTATENNSDHYVIETSMDGLHFDRENVIEAAGTSISSNSYNSTFSQNAKYVRLKLVNADGMEEIIRVLSVDCASDNITLYPNPTNDVLFITGLDASSKYTVLTASGKVIYQNMTNSQLDLSSFAEGVYLLRVEHNGKVITHKVVKK